MKNILAIFAFLVLLVSCDTKEVYQGREVVSLSDSRFYGTFIRIEPEPPSRFFPLSSLLVEWRLNNTNKLISTVFRIDDSIGIAVDKMGPNIMEIQIEDGQLRTRMWQREETPWNSWIDFRFYGDGDFHLVLNPDGDYRILELVDY